MTERKKDRVAPLSFQMEDGSHVVVSRKRGSISVSIDEVPIYYFDLAGRLTGCYLENEHHYRRGLGNRLLEKWSSGSADGVRLRRDVVEKEKDNFSGL